MSDFAVNLARRGAGLPPLVSSGPSTLPVPAPSFPVSGWPSLLRLPDRPETTYCQSAPVADQAVSFEDLTGLQEHEKTIARPPADHEAFVEEPSILGLEQPLSQAASSAEKLTPRFERSMASSLAHRPFPVHVLSSAGTPSSTPEAQARLSPPPREVGSRTGKISHQNYAKDIPGETLYQGINTVQYSAPKTSGLVPSTGRSPSHINPQQTSSEIPNPVSAATPVPAVQEDLEKSTRDTAGATYLGTNSARAEPQRRGPLPQQTVPIISFPQASREKTAPSYRAASTSALPNIQVRIGKVEIRAPRPSPSSPVQQKGTSGFADLALARAYLDRIYR